jgi:hypothetical protein
MLSEMEPGILQGLWGTQNDLADCFKHLQTLLGHSLEPSLCTPHPD